MKPEPTFAKEDVWAIAQAVLDAGSVHEVESGRCAWLACGFCGERQQFDYSGPYRRDPKEPFPHALTCPVVIARDVLTGAPE